MPTAETAAQTATRQSVGGENDGPSRQPARFVQDVAQNDATGMRVPTVDLAQDNVHFGLRAVDRDGHRSPVTYPVPVTT